MGRNRWTPSIPTLQFAPTVLGRDSWQKMTIKKAVPELGTASPFAGEHARRLTAADPFFFTAEAQGSSTVNRGGWVGRVVVANPWPCTFSIPSRIVCVGTTSPIFRILDRYRFQYPRSDRVRWNLVSPCATSVSTSRWRGVSFQYPQSDRVRWNVWKGIRGRSRMQLSVSPVGSCALEPSIISGGIIPRCSHSVSPVG